MLDKKLSKLVMGLDSSFKARPMVVRYAE